MLSEIAAPWYKTRATAARAVRALLGSSLSWILASRPGSRARRSTRRAERS